MHVAASTKKSQNICIIITTRLVNIAAMNDEIVIGNRILRSSNYRVIDFKISSINNRVFVADYRTDTFLKLHRALVGIKKHTNIAITIGNTFFVILTSLVIHTVFCLNLLQILGMQELLWRFMIPPAASMRSPYTLLGSFFLSFSSNKPDLAVL